MKIVKVLLSIVVVCMSTTSAMAQILGPMVTPTINVANQFHGVGKGLIGISENGTGPCEVALSKAKEKCERNKFSYCIHTETRLGHGVLPEAVRDYLLIHLNMVSLIDAKCIATVTGTNDLAVSEALEKTYQTVGFPE